MDESTDEKSTEEQNLDLSGGVPLLHQLGVLKLRHLQRVVGCNVGPPPGYSKPRPPSCLPAMWSRQPLQYGYFLSLYVSCAADCPPFLTTELQCSASPLWSMLHIVSTTPCVLHTAKGIVARVWYKPAPSEDNTNASAQSAPSSTAGATGSCKEASDTSTTNVTKDDNNLPPTVNRSVTLYAQSHSKIFSSSKYAPDLRNNSTNRVNGSISNSSSRTFPYSTSVASGNYLKLSLFGTKYNNRHSKSRDVKSINPPTSSTLPSKPLPPEPPKCTNTSPSVLVLTWAIHFSGLVPIGTNLSQAAASLATNTLVFQLRGEMLYTAADSIVSPLPGDDDPSIRRLWYGIKLPMSQTKRSYSPASLTKLHQTERDISILQARCRDRRERLQYVAKLTPDSRHTELYNKVCAVQARLRLARDVAQREREGLTRLRGRVEDAEARNQEKGMQLLTLLQLLGRERQQLRNSCSHSEQQLQQLHKIRALLSHRRTRLMRKLAHVYPIVQISAKDEFSISDIWVPDAQLHNQSNLTTPNFHSNLHRSKPSKTSSSTNKLSSSSLKIPNSPKSRSSPSNSIWYAGDAKKGGNSSTSDVQNPPLNESSTTSNTGNQASGKPPLAPAGNVSAAASTTTTSTATTSTSTTATTTNNTHESPTKSNPPHGRAVHPSFHPYQQPSVVTVPHSTESMSAGLGMSTHLLCLVSGLLQVPLKYPMSPAGSVATVTDIASTQLHNDNRKFPLYTRGKERERLHFNYAVFLLNKNIAQLHHYVGLPKPLSPAATLPNLYTLVMHLSNMDKPLTEFLPDLRCQPLLTTNTDLKADLLLPHLPQSTSLHSIPHNSNSLGNPIVDASEYQRPRSPRHGQSPRLLSRSATTGHSPKYALSKSPSASPSHSIKIPASAQPQFDRSPVNGGLLALSSSLGDLAISSSSGNREKVLTKAKVGEGLISGSFDKRHGAFHAGSSGFGNGAQVSFSLDEGLDHIREVVMRAKDIEIFAGKDTLATRNLNVSPFVNSVVKSPVLKNATGSLTNLSKEKPLMVVHSSIDFEDSTLANFEDQTTNLLRSWHEDNPSPCCSTFATCGSTDLLEEVGVEATENFMTSSDATARVVDFNVSADQTSLRESQGLLLIATQINDAATGDWSSRKQSDGINSNYSTINSADNLVSNGDNMQPEAVAQSGKSEINNKKLSTKSKSRNLWPFSRSNTSDENSRESNSIDSSSRFSSLELDEPQNQLGPIRGSYQNEPPPSKLISSSNTSNDMKDTRNPSDVSLASSTVAGKDNTTGTLTSVTPTANTLPAMPSSTTKDTDTLAAAAAAAAAAASLAEKASTDKLLQESLAAIDCDADMSKLSDLTEVTNRTAKLASKTFSFKMGAK